jgi:hypothetical protein
MLLLTGHQGPWSKPEFARHLPIVAAYLDGSQSWSLQNVCHSWYKAKWEHRYTTPLNVIVGSHLDGKGAQKELATFFSHFQLLTYVTIHNCYVNNHHLSLLFPEKTVTHLEVLSFDMLSNHSEITHEGISQIVDACPNLRSFSLTFLGGARSFGCRVGDNSLKYIAEKLTSLTSLSVGVEIASLPTLSQMTSLSELRIRFCEAIPPPPSATPSSTTSTGTTLKVKKEEIPPIDLQLAQKNILILSQGLSQSLKKLSVHRVVMGWEQFLSSLHEDSFQRLEELHLSYDYRTPGKIQKIEDKIAWKGEALRSLIIHSVSGFSMLPFMKIPLQELHLSVASTGISFLK